MQNKLVDLKVTESGIITPLENNPGTGGGGGNLGGGGGNSSGGGYGCAVACYISCSNNK
ncbi:hypothetical protein ACDZ28_15875 [Paenibacillus sp. RS8]|uniref:hypothetical protein n=1 Tax=Paenibacillus sp. RS8 TaxID=3242681 RepID=UPI0035C24816